MSLTQPIFRKLTLTRKRFAKKSYTEFHENTPNELVASAK
jgi:hypothetical protein